MPVSKFFYFLLLFPAAPLAAVRPYAVIARPVRRLVVAIRNSRPRARRRKIPCLPCVKGGVTAFGRDGGIVQKDIPRPGAGYFCPRRQKYPKTPFKPAV